MLLLFACTGSTTPPDTDSPTQPPPQPPAGLTHWLTGDDANVHAPVPVQQILMGGGVEPDDAFADFAGDVVVLRASGEDGYNDYLYDLRPLDSVETLLVDTPELADSDYVAWRVDHAEAVFLAGGDQWVYLDLWGGTALQAALQRASQRGIVGGTSAGLAVLGDRVFSAQNGTVYPDEAVEDPWNTSMTFEDDFLDLPALDGVITDSHFSERDRMPRLLAFLCRMHADGWEAPVGVGVDESTAWVLDADGSRVVGSGVVYRVAPDAPPERCQAGEGLVWTDVPVTVMTAQDETGTTVSVP